MEAPLPLSSYVLQDGRVLSSLTHRQLGVVIPGHSGFVPALLGKDAEVFYALPASEFVSTLSL